MKLENGPRISLNSVIALKWKPEATKCSDHYTVSLIAHLAKITARILGGRIESKMEDVLVEDQCGFRRGKGTGDVRGLEL